MVTPRGSTLAGWANLSLATTKGWKLSHIKNNKKSA